MSALARGAWRLFCLIFVVTLAVVLFQIFLGCRAPMNGYDLVPYVEYAQYSGDVDVNESRVGGQFVPRPLEEGRPFRDTRAEATIERLSAVVEAAGLNPNTATPASAAEDVHLITEDGLWGNIGLGGGGAASAVLTMLALMRYGLIGGKAKATPEPA